MSNPVTNVEIEDVLSSIRRLVSEGDKLRDGSEPAGRPRTNGQADGSRPGVLELGVEDRADTTPNDEGDDADDKAAAPVRFVLTSAYRIDGSGSDDDDGGASDDPERGRSDMSDAPTGGDGHDGSLLESAEATSDSGEVPDWIAEGQAELDALEALHLTPAEAVSDHGNAAPAEDPGHRRTAGDRKGLETTISELEAAIAESSDEWEPDGSEETPVMDWSNVSDTDVFFSSRFASGGPVEDAEVQSEEPRPSASHRDAVSDMADAGREEASDKAGDWDHDPGKEAVAATSDPMEQQLASYLDQDDVLDEETLREMVADIVRQELQGTLGERITRNVRKLVRREIYRALAEHGID